MKKTSETDISIPSEQMNDESLSPRLTNKINKKIDDFVSVQNSHKKF